MARNWPPAPVCKVIPLGTTEIKDVSYSFASEMELDQVTGLPGLTIDTDPTKTFMWSQPDDLTITNVGVDAAGTAITAVVRDPRPAQAYALYYQATLSNGSVFVSENVQLIAGWDSSKPV